MVCFIMSPCWREERRRSRSKVFECHYIESVMDTSVSGSNGSPAEEEEVAVGTTDDDTNRWMTNNTEEETKNFCPQTFP